MACDSVIVITNNPKVLLDYPSARWVSGNAQKVLLECRKKIHEGYPVLAHPLMGDLHLLRNPFRTVLLGMKANQVDLRSLDWIEESIARIRLFCKGHPQSEEFKDYQLLDLDLFRTSMGFG